jgi:hypothetical protein
VKLPRHDPKLLSSHDIILTEQWPKCFLSTLYLWIAYLDLGKVIQRMSKSEILIVKLNKSSTLVQRSFHMPIIVKNSVQGMWERMDSRQRIDRGPMQ